MSSQIFCFSIVCSLFSSPLTAYPVLPLRYLRSPFHSSLFSCRSQICLTSPSFLFHRLVTLNCPNQLFSSTLFPHPTSFSSSFNPPYIFRPSPFAFSHPFVPFRFHRLPSIVPFFPPLLLLHGPLPRSTVPVHLTPFLSSLSLRPTRFVFRSSVLMPLCLISTLPLCSGGEFS